jgi:hypothetical protein
MMAEFIDMIDEYRIQKGSRDYIVSNVNGKYENHGHFQKLSTCYTLIRLMQKKKIPRSAYLLEAARRITTDAKYKQTLELKQLKNKQRQRYFNPNKGVRKW